MVVFRQFAACPTHHHLYLITLRLVFFFFLYHGGFLVRKVERSLLHLSYNQFVTSPFEIFRNVAKSYGVQLTHHLCNDLYVRKTLPSSPEIEFLKPHFIKRG